MSRTSEEKFIGPIQHKKMMIYWNIYYKPFKKVLISVIIHWVRKTKCIFKKEISMEDHKMTKQDKLVYAITLAAIFFGVLGIGLIGLTINIFGG